MVLFRLLGKAKDSTILSHRVELKLPGNVRHMDRSANGHPLPQVFKLLDWLPSDLARYAQHEFRTVAADARVVNANTVMI